MNLTALAPLTLRLDAVANALLGVVALLGATPLSAAAGLDRSPLVALGVVLLGNAAVLWRGAAAPTRAPYRLFALVDVAFVVLVAWFAAADPTGAEGWVRAVLAGLALVVAVIAAVKLFLGARLIEFTGRA